MSYLDKLRMMEILPYDKNIFIDADCLVYGNLTSIWKFMPKSGVSCFGKSLPLNSEEGWFCINDIGDYSSKVTFIPQMHGGLVFINNDDLTRKIHNLCLEIVNNYHRFKFKYFAKPADEPVLALSMAVYGEHPAQNADEIGWMSFFPE